MSRNAQMLARLAELDLAAAERAHAQMMAATDDDAFNGLGRTYQRMARSLRQTVALKMRAEEKRANDRARAVLLGERDADRRDHLIETRLLDLQDAVARIAAAAIPDAEACEARLDRFDLELD